MLELEKISKKVVWKKFASLVRKLPLEQCTFEQNPLTGERGWRAPQDKAFEISGHFVLNSDQLDGADWIGPNSSAALLKEEYKNKYDIALEEAEGDKAYAWQLFLDEIASDGMPAMAPTSFRGRWLVALPDLAGSFSNNQEPSLTVKGEIEAWYEQDNFGFINDLAPDSDTVTSCMYYSTKGVKKWQQYYACAVLGHCRIKMVDCPEEEQEFFLPKPVKSEFVRPEKNGLYVQTQRRVGQKAEEIVQQFIREGGLSCWSLKEGGLVIARACRGLATPTKKELQDFLSEMI